jgi:glycerol-3-phosphate dehydrogenase
VRVEDVSAGKVSRKHALHDHARSDGVPGIVSVVGGKVTGYRAIAEEVGDLVGRRLHAGVDSATETRRLPGGHLDDLQSYVTSEVWPRARALGLDREQADHLGSVYGSLALEVLELAERDPGLSERVCPHQPTIAAQLVRAVENEWALSIGDVLLRRTPLGLAACQALDCLEVVVAHLAPLLGWDKAEEGRQMDAYRREIEPMRRFSHSPEAVAR